MLIQLKPHQKHALGVPNKPIVVIEDSFLRLRCAATGLPRPDIVWSRLDGRPITDGAWQGKCDISR